MTGAALRSRREALGLSTTELAAAAKVTQPAVVRVEHAVRIKPGTYTRYLAALTRAAAAKQARSLRELAARIEVLADSGSPDQR